MMNWIAKIGALMRSMGSFAYRQVLRGGRTVWELFHVPSEPMPAPVADPLREQTDADDYDAVKRLAAAMMLPAGPKPADFAKVPDLTVKWLRTLDRADLARVAVADPEKLRGHFRGGAPMRGMAPYDAQAVADVTAAKRKPAAREGRPQTFGDFLEQHGFVPAQ